MPTVIRGEDGIVRCRWGDSPLEYRFYHDFEWGFPVADDRCLFEKLCLEGFQAGPPVTLGPRIRTRGLGVFDACSICFTGGGSA